MANPTEHVLVIGGLSPIGSEITKGLMKSGYKVYFTGDDEGKLEGLVERFNGRNPKYACESATIDMTNLPAICKLWILYIPFHTVIVIPNSHDVDYVYSEDFNDIDMLPPLFLNTTIGPYLLIRKLIEKARARSDQNALEIRFIFIANVNQFNTLLHWRKQGFDNFLKKDEREFIGTKVTKNDIWKGIQLGLAMLSEHLHTTEFHRVRSLTINKLSAINDKNCASAVIQIIKNYPAYEANRRNVFEPNSPSDKLIRGVWGLKEREFFIEYLQNKIKDHSRPPAVP